MDNKSSEYTNHMAIENCLLELFMKYGYNAYIDNTIYDIIIENKKRRYNIELKISRNKIRYDKLILEFLDKQKAGGRLSNFILILIGYIDNSLKYEIEEKYNIRVFDINVIINALNPFDDLKDTFISLLPFSLKDTVCAIDFDKYSDIFRTRKFQEPLISETSYVDKLKKLPKGREYFSQYEDLCAEILKYLFKEQLSLWNTQAKSNADLFRFDLICKIKNNTELEFWNILKRFYDTLYVVFEFKNYSERITQSQIYTTEKYLYAKALRRVAIIITREGLDANAEIAQRGVLREDGKLIICLSDEDIIKMIRMKEKGDEPCDYLSDYLDNLLVDLEK